MEAKKRLIDAKKFGMYLADIQLANRGWKDDICEFLDDMMDALDEAPTVDAVEVVRCKDCKHCTVISNGIVCEHALPTKTMKDYYIYGSMILARVEPNDFCSRGERREG